MNSPGHEMILASAGSGKTYALTNRYVQLLALGAAPERIVALTFTRKAAGEFFDEILTKLARAAGDPRAAGDLATRIGLARFDAGDFRRLLRAMIDAMPRLALGTFDAFFARIVRSFPLELGLSGDFTLLEDYAAQFERRRVLRHLFARSAGEPDTAQREFIESFKRATFGREEKQLAGLLDEFIDEHQRSYQLAADAILWGEPNRIWPGGCVWLDQISGRSAAVIVRTWATDATLTAGQRQRWFDFLDAYAAWAPGINPPAPLEYVLGKVLDAWNELGRGDVSLVIDRRKVTVPPEVGAALRDITREIFCGEFTRRLEATRGIFGLLARYDAAYDTIVRRTGKLTFADVERLLAEGELIPPASAASSPPDHDATEGQTFLALDLASSDMTRGDDRRLLLDWRLDAKFDHWLLDEFQDTSRTQWQVLQNLIDEVIQDISQRRTFFCVGDVKQAIYGWRGGDARLFREILERYNSGPQPAIRLTPMDDSYRSGEAVLELVNRVFGDRAALRELCGGAGERWSEDWRPHTSAVPQHRGQAAWLFADSSDERFARTRELLEEIRPLERGLSVAVLTQKNKTATQLADYLRREARMPAVAEADLHVCADNPATAVVLALLKVAAHPGDSLAWQHVRMSPLRDALRTHDLETRDALTRHVLSQVHHDGFEATVTWWWRNLEPALTPDDAFTAGRGRQLVEAARRFDETGVRDVAEFLQFAERHVVRDAETAGVIRVMTIHKSKGLGFDVVIVPDLEGKRLATRRDGLAIHTAGGSQIEWVLDLPTSFFREYDRVLAEHVEFEEIDACYEKIALLYVALTRAKRALYLVSSNARASESRNIPRLLASTLGGDRDQVPVGSRTFAGGYSTGDPQWFASVRATAPVVTSRALSTLAPESTMPITRHIARTPSAQRAGRLSGAALFGAGRAGAASFGVAVHAALAAVSWWDPPAADVWLEQVRRQGLPEDAIRAARACLDAPALASVFRPPVTGAGEVWRERSFELVHEGIWITGRFDRVLIEHTASGEVSGVRVIDFKTDQTGPSPGDWRRTADHFRPQVAWYRRAAARLAGVPESLVRCEIVLTAARDSTGQPPAPLELT